MDRRYGLPPELIERDFQPDWHEYMHYLYLPVVMPGEEGIRVPPNLEWIRLVLRDITLAELDEAHQLYVYVTARRGYATPGNPLNRPGWHADGFGTNDINYIWSDRWPTRFAVGEFDEISDDHVRSAEQFEEQINSHAHRSCECSPNGPPMRECSSCGGTGRVRRDGGRIRVEDAEPNAIYRLDPSVVHATPIIEPPGGDRSFFKVSVSPDRYNLLGNSHNHLFDYEWRMYSRSEIRNDPAYAGGDSGPQGG